MNSEFVRFVLTGGFAAAVNVVSRILLSFVMPFSVAVVFAYLVGMVTAFCLNRQFVFEKSDRQVGGQAVRFVMVNLIALAQVWVISIALADWAFPAIGLVWHREVIAHLIGVLSPVVTSYFGHKYFTFGNPTRDPASTK